MSGKIIGTISQGPAVIRSAGRSGWHQEVRQASIQAIKIIVLQISMFIFLFAGALLYNRYIESDKQFKINKVGKMVKDLKRVESRNKILDIAEKYFAKNGITDTDIAEICRQAGLTRSAFYYHFPTKQQFLLELLDKWVLNMAGHLKTADFQPETCTAIFYGIIDKMQPVFENAGKQLPIFLELYIKAVNDPVLKNYVSASYNSFFDFYRGTLEEKVISKSMTAEDAEDVAKILIALTFGFLIQGVVNPGSTDWTKLAKKSVDLLLK